MAEHAAVIGIGQTNFDAKRVDVSQVGLIREAALRALEDAQLSWADIDAVVIEGPALPREPNDLSQKPAVGCHLDPLSDLIQLLGEEDRPGMGSRIDSLSGCEGLRLCGPAPEEEPQECAHDTYNVGNSHETMDI